MAKFTAAKVKDEYKSYPSQFGSHRSMIDNSYVLMDESMVVCVDENGPYVTNKSILDSGVADPLRTLDTDLRKKKLKKLVKE